MEQNSYMRKHYIDYSHLYYGRKCTEMKHIDETFCWNHRVDSVIESSLGSNIMHLFIRDETFVRWQ